MRKEKEALAKYESLLIFMKDAKNYPPNYKNYRHGQSNYWYHHCPQRTVALFSPELSKRPFVPHPHMHYEYLRTMMDYYVRNSDNYMFPQLENVHSTIPFVGRNTIVATPLTDTAQYS